MDPIVPFDWQRLLIGDAPPAFLLEVVLRTTVILVWTGALLRWIGGRSISQLSLIEFLLVIALGSAVGDSLFYPDVPLIPAMLAILLVVLADRAVDLGILRWKRFKRAVDGRPVEILREGRILTDGIRSRRIGTTEVMEMLRLKKIENLGQVRLAYLEPSGVVSVFAAVPPRPGLQIVPPPEIGDPAPPLPGTDACCLNCGATARAAGRCPCCGKTRWTQAQPCDPL